MKKVFVILLALFLLTVSVSAQNYLVRDGEDLLTDQDATMLEELYQEYSNLHGFTPVLVTTDSFGGRTAEAFAGDFYDANGYPEDGILLLVSLQEGQWYILTNGACYDYISDYHAEMIGQELVEYIRAGEYYEGFALFPELAEYYFAQSSVSQIGGADAPSGVAVVSKRNYGKTIAICMGVGLLIGLITVGIMASRMKTVRMQHNAADYVRPGSMTVTNRRDIYLYSHVRRTPRPKSNSSGGSRGGGGRGGAGGRI